MNVMHTSSPKPPSSSPNPSASEPPNPVLSFDTARFNPGIDLVPDADRLIGALAPPGAAGNSSSSSNGSALRATLAALAGALLTGGSIYPIIR